MSIVDWNCSCMCVMRYSPVETCEWMRKMLLQILRNSVYLKRKSHNHQEIHVFSWQFEFIFDSTKNSKNQHKQQQKNNNFERKIKITMVIEMKYVCTQLSQNSILLPLLCVQTKHQHPYKKCRVLLFPPCLITEDKKIFEPRDFFFLLEAM